ncbi:MAG: hypothetical protein ACRD4Y_11960 [Candidatus Acidiferrales bacterium]
MKCTFFVSVFAEWDFCLGKKGSDSFWEIDAALPGGFCGAGVFQAFLFRLTASKIADSVPALLKRTST